jgi:hypothetical protein
VRISLATRLLVRPWWPSSPVASLDGTVEPNDA